MPSVSLSKSFQRAVSCLILTSSLALTGCKDEKKQAGPPPKPEVDVVVLQTQPVTLKTDLPGRTAPYRTAEIRPQVGGVILKRLFTEGDTVKAGQVLYQIDPAPYEAALGSARAQLLKGQAALQTSQATVGRYRPLVTANAISKQDLDNAVGTLGGNQADIAAAQAGIKSAQINLNYTKVTSPITGKTGRSAVTEGALVTANQTTTLVTVTQLDPIYVDVAQPSTTILRLRRELASGQIKSAGADQIEVHLLLEDNSRYEQPGKLQFSEVTVDQGTGAITLRAIFPNTAGLLLPGMFVQEEIEEGVRQDGILVPQQGITHNSKGEATALLVGKDGKVESRVVTTDRAIGDAWLIGKGLNAGDRIIVKGVQSAKPGAEVTAHEVKLDVPSGDGTNNPPAKQ
ncbi:MAG: efflux RND transporter periplasmic adaptor subunit [Janthinobacterium lividum]